LTRAHSFLPEPLFVEMASWNPLDADDRARYDDAAVRRILTWNPDAARARYEVKLGGRGHLMVSRYPLSMLVALGASVETVRLATKACPAALHPSEEFRSTPLHTACTFNTSLEVVRYLYHKYPEAIKQTTNYVYLPIHNACQTGIPEPCSLEMIQFLVEAYPEGLMTINKLGDTPLRTAQRNKHITEVVLEYLQEETERVFSLEENENIRDEVVERQSWGSKQGSSFSSMKLNSLSSPDFSFTDWSRLSEAETSTQEITSPRLETIGESNTAV
jgi:Ankyrin repeats (many copies)